MSKRPISYTVICGRVIEFGGRGDEAFEAQLYQPHNIEKIVAWGGLASIKHVTKYIQPGLELISLDPKRSASIVGAEGVESDEMLWEAAVRIATDVGTGNQTACSSCRIVYVMCGTDDDGVERLKQLGKLTYDAILALPSVSERQQAHIKPLWEFAEGESALVA